MTRRGTVEPAGVCAMAIFNSYSFFGEPACPHRAVLIAIDHCGGSSSEAAKQQTITDFSWSAWAGAALRPNLAYSYNNWVPGASGHPKADAIVWSVLSVGRELLD
jgi:hypothetical protein